MKTAITLLFIVTWVSLEQNSYSQVITADSVKVGKIYSILMTNGSTLECEVTGIDSLHFMIRNIDGVIGKIPKEYVEKFTIPSSEIISVYQAKKYGTKVKDTGEKMKPNLSLGGGIGLTSLESKQGFPTSGVLNFEGILYLSRHTAMRLNVNSNFLSNSNNNNYNNPYSYEVGGDEYIHVIILDLFIGNLKPEDNTRQYFICGLGTLIYKESASTTYYNDGTYSYSFSGNGGSFPIPGLEFGYGLSHRFSPKFTAGFELLHGGFLPLLGGLISVKPKLNYSLTKNLSMFVEPQYTFPYLIDDDNSFPVDKGYLTMKFGVTLGSF